MNYINYFISFFILTLFFFLIIKQKDLFKIKKTNIHNNFTSNNNAYLIGGPIIFFLLAYYYYHNLLLLLFFFLFLLIGILSDLKILINPNIRLWLQIFITLLATIFLELTIKNTKFLPLDFLLKDRVFNIFFVTFCILILLNGCNFVDGLNNLLSSYIFLIILNIILFQENANIDIPFLKILATLLIVLFIFNCFGLIFFGDSGSYLLGFILSYILIPYSQNNLVSPYYIILLLWYPCFEVLFSMIRRLARNKNLQSPDSRHLHQLLYIFIKQKIKSANNSIVHFITVSIINLYNFTIIYFGGKYFLITQYMVSLIFLNLVIYNFTYYFLFKWSLKKKGI